MGRIGIARGSAVAGLALTVACGISVIGVSPEGSSATGDAAAAATGGDHDVPGASSGGAAPVDASANDASSAGPIFGEDCPKGTTYVDDFSTDPKDRWIVGHATWTWSATDKTYTVTGFDQHGVVWIGARPKWMNYSVEIELRVSPGITGGNAGALFRIMNFGTPPIDNNEGQMFLAAVVLSGDDDVIFGTENDGWTQNNQINNGNTPANTSLKLRAEAKGPAIKIYTDDTLRLDVNNNKFASGSIGIKTYGLPLSVRRVEVKCL